MRVLLAAPLILLLIVFALSNKQLVTIGLWPTDIQTDVPLGPAVLVASAVFFLAGGFIGWASAAANGMRARRAETTVRQLEAQVEAMRARPAIPLLPPRS